MADQNESALTGSVLLYNNPEPLDLQRHAKLGVRRVPMPFGFAANQHFVPLNVNEFGPAGVIYPIIFAGESYTPLAVLGLRPEENLFIDRQGAYRAGCYIPAFLRRYPFIGALDNSGQRVIICIDRGSDLVTEDNPDLMLFENGEATEYTKACVEFCSQFDTDRARTESFVAMLKELDLFEPKQTTYNPRNSDGSSGQPVLISEYFAVSETRLRELSPDQLVRLRDTGALSQIYNHLHSLYLWDRLITETLAQRSGAMPTAGNA
jgi:hypothetical protein